MEQAYRFLLKTFKKGIHALIILFSAAILFYFINIHVPINILTLSCSFLLGLPGVFLVVLFTLATYYLF